MSTEYARVFRCVVEQARDSASLDRAAMLVKESKDDGRLSPDDYRELVAVGKRKRQEMSK